MATPILHATFDPKVKLYWFFQGLWIHLLLVTAVIGVVTLPLWLLGGGQWFCSRRYVHLSATLTDRAIQLKTGAWARVEKTIPLEQIQDLSLRTGPLLNLFGLASVQIETAGQSAPNGADMLLPGLVDAAAFRDAVMQQREALMGMRRQEPASAQAASPTSEALLTDIRDTLHRIEGLLDRGQQKPPA